MSHHLSPSLSHYTSAAHACFGVCVSVSINCDCVYWLFVLLLSYSLNLLHFRWQGNCGLTLQDTLARILDVTPSGVCRWFQECLCVWEVPSVLVAVDVHTERICYCNTDTHAHHLKAETVLLCLYLAPWLGIPGNAHRVYWHSCLIACSIVHSVRAKPPPPPNLSLSVPLSLGLSLTLQSIRLIILTHTQLWSTARQRIHQNRHRHTCKLTRKQTVITVHRQYLKDTLI